YADCVTKIVLVRHNGFQRTLRKRTMANLAAAGPARPSRFSYAKWRKVVMQNEPLRLFAAAVGIEHLRLLDRRQRSERHRLSFPTLKNGRAVRSWSNAHFAT